MNCPHWHPDQTLRAGEEEEGNQLGFHINHTALITVLFSF